MLKYRPLLLWILPVSLMAIIWALSSLSTLPFYDNSIYGMDKVLHFFAYAALAFSIALCIPRSQWIGKPGRSIVFIMLVAAVYGGIDEYHQSFMPYRDVSVFDWIADVSGALISTIIAVIIARRIRKV